MKHLKISIYLLLTGAIFISCEKETTTLPQNSELNTQQIVYDNYNTKLEMYNQYLIDNPNSKSQNQVSARAEFAYLSQLCDGTTISATHYFGTNIGDKSTWDYYYFDGKAGDIISIYVPRTGPDYDPIFQLYEGTTTNFELDGLNQIAMEDDTVPDNFDSCWGDPYLKDFELPVTGTYTLAIYSWGTCGGNGPSTYDIITTGIICNDDDRDGVLNENDAYPNSNMSEKINIKGCNPNVNNVLVRNGAFMMDQIDALIDEINSEYTGRNYDYLNRKFIMELERKVTDWRRNRLINNRERDAILRCARSSNIPYILI